MKKAARYKDRVVIGVKVDVDWKKFSTKAYELTCHTFPIEVWKTKDDVYFLTGYYEEIFDSLDDLILFMEAEHDENFLEHSVNKTPAFAIGSAH